MRLRLISPIPTPTLPLKGRESFLKFSIAGGCCAVPQKKPSPVEGRVKGDLLSGLLAEPVLPVQNPVHIRDQVFGILKTN